MDQKWGRAVRHNTHRTLFPVYFNSHNYWRKDFFLPVCAVLYTKRVTYVTVSSFLHYSTICFVFFVLCLDYVHIIRWSEKLFITYLLYFYCVYMANPKIQMQRNSNPPPRIKSAYLRARENGVQTNFREAFTTVLFQQNIFIKIIAVHVTYYHLIKLISVSKITCNYKIFWYYIHRTFPVSLLVLLIFYDT